MKAVILSAGYAKRLGDVVKKQPKPTLEINGKSVIERIIDRLHMHGIYQIIANAHYLPLALIRKTSPNILYFHEPELLGHKGTLNALRPWLEGETFFVINGDTISNVDFRQMELQKPIGNILSAMDEYRSIGVWLYPFDYFHLIDPPIIPYRPQGLEWHDIGTPERLEAAKQFYEKT